MLKRLPAGELTTLVSIEARDRTRGGHGGVTGDWDADTDSDGNAITRWAKVETIAGDESTTQTALSAEATLRVTFDFVDELTSQKRIRIGSRILNIASVDDIDNAGITHVCECREDMK